MIQLDAQSATPLYEQLYAALAAEIREGARPAGTALPGRRTMAAQLGVSVNTVDAAYQMLAAEGWAEARPRSGFLCTGNRRAAASAGFPRARPSARACAGARRPVRPFDRQH